MDGKLVFSCMTLAMDAQGRKIETVEGLADGDNLHPLQEAFIEKDALMCGFCTPGFLMSSKALLDANGDPTPEEVREGTVRKHLSLRYLSPRVRGRDERRRKDAEGRVSLCSRR